jgi:hypothetical protein
MPAAEDDEHSIARLNDVKQVSMDRNNKSVNESSEDSSSSQAFIERKRGQMRGKLILFFLN